MKNIVYIATSIDGYIADKNGSVDWLHEIDNPTQDDMGFSQHMASVDALVMGRNTLDIVLSFGIEWPYDKPVFVLSRRFTCVPDGLEGKVFLLNTDVESAVTQLRKQGFKNLYIDGGNVIQQFLTADLIDEMVISTIPILLGDGIKLFSQLPVALTFDLVDVKSHLSAIVQSTYRRKR